MSDLISRDDLYNELVKLETLARNRVLDTPTYSPCYSRYSAQLSERTRLKELVMDFPIAYNVDKVVEELEENSHEYKTKPDDLGYVTTGRRVYLKDAIEIVKAGGVE